jgi:hypothetical protein
MNAPISAALEQQVLEAVYSSKLVFLCGNRKVVYKFGKYIVQHACTDSEIAQYIDKQQAIHHAVSCSNRR